MQYPLHLHRHLFLRSSEYSFFIFAFKIYLRIFCDKYLITFLMTKPFFCSVAQEEKISEKNFCSENRLICVVTEHFAVGAGSRRFDFQVGQIGRSVAIGLPTPRCFFEAVLPTQVLPLVTRFGLITRVLRRFRSIIEVWNFLLASVENMQPE